VIARPLTAALACVAVLLLGAGIAASLWLRATTVVIGSKKFTESVILGEMGTQLLQEAGVRADHAKQLGGTQILWWALLTGEIDAYPEYTGTLRADILRDDRPPEEALAEKGVRLSRSLGFANSYALGMRAPEARRRGIKTISDLKNHPDLRYGFSEEFRNRPDGWPGLSARYGLSAGGRGPGTYDHDVAVKSVGDGELDVTDVYTTEGALRERDLVALEDDLHFFPDYEAVWVYRADLPAGAVAQLTRLEGRLSERDMIDANARAERRESEARLSADLIGAALGVTIVPVEESAAMRLLRLTGEHLFLVCVSLSAAVVVAVPLGVFAAKRPWAGAGILGVVGVFQTIPSLALLMFFIPWLGLGAKPAIAALFLYSLLPVVRNTHAGLRDIPPGLRESAQALGLPPSAVLRLVELPLASRSILAGIKTAAVINVGTATLGALINAGGYGQPILSGIRLGDTGLILQGAIPAALMALAVQGLFTLIERRRPLAA
jgi:osmoprotectant transport system permease protein